MRCHRQPTSCEYSDRLVASRQEKKAFPLRRPHIELQCTQTGFIESSHRVSTRNSSLRERGKLRSILQSNWLPSPIGLAISLSDYAHDLMLPPLHHGGNCREVESSSSARRHPVSHHPIPNIGQRAHSASMASCHTMHARSHQR